MEFSNNLEEENKKLKAKLDSYERKKKEKWSKRYNLSKNLSNKFLGTKLKNSINNLFTELQEKRRVSKDTVSDLLAALFIRITRIGVFLLITSLLPTMLILLQVYYLKSQNRLITGQNERMKQQTFLQEAGRRSYMIGILDQIIKEVTTEGGLNGSKKRPNITRLIALSKNLKPYHYLDNDQLTPNALSPERGYLLLNLLESNINLDATIDYNTDKSLLSALNFDYAELKNASITGLNIEKIHLDYTDLEGSNFTKSVLKGDEDIIDKKGKKIISGEKTTFTHANLVRTVFESCDITNCNFYKANLLNTSFMNSTLNKTSFIEANLENANFSNSSLSKINFKDANLFNTNFDNTSVPANFMEIMEQQLPRKSFNYLEQSYTLKIHNKRGLLIRKKLN